MQIMCAWCQKVGVKRYSLSMGSELKSFCSEKCFAACRRAYFKRNKVIFLPHHQWYSTFCSHSMHHIFSHSSATCDHWGQEDNIKLRTRFQKFIKQAWNESINDINILPTMWPVIAENCMNWTWCSCYSSHLLALQFQGIFSLKEYIHLL